MPVQNFFGSQTLLGVTRWLAPIYPVTRHNPGHPYGVWTLAKFMGAWLSFSRVFNQFSISHVIAIGFVGLSLQQPD